MPFARSGRGKKFSGFLSSFLLKKKLVFAPLKRGIFWKKSVRFSRHKKREGEEGV
jgi:hypothetical protein